MFKHVQCPKCGYANIVHTHIYRNATVVFDTCLKCGNKLLTLKTTKNSNAMNKLQELGIQCLKANIEFRKYVDSKEGKTYLREKMLKEYGVEMDGSSYIMGWTDLDFSGIINGERKSFSYDPTEDTLYCGMFDKKKVEKLNS